MPEYLLDDIARAAGTTTRNVRAYAERGLLPPRDARAAPTSTTTLTSPGCA